MNVVTYFTVISFNKSHNGHEGWRSVKIIQNFVTSFIDDPLIESHRIECHLFKAAPVLLRPTRRPLQHVLLRRVRQWGRQQQQLLERAWLHPDLRSWRASRSCCSTTRSRCSQPLQTGILTFPWQQNMIGIFPLANFRFNCCEFSLMDSPWTKSAHNEKLRKLTVIITHSYCHWQCKICLLI